MESFSQVTFTTAKNQAYFWSNTNAEWYLYKTTFQPIKIDFNDKKILVYNENLDVYTIYKIASKTEETKSEYGSYELRCIDGNGIKCVCFIYFEDETVMKFVFMYSDLKIVYSKNI